MKRRRVLLVLLALAILAAAGWFLWLPNHRPGLEPGERYGVDVSHHQGQIDWEVVAGDGIGFAYIKVTQSTDFTDPRFAENWEGAQTAGLDVGAYHFFSLCTPGAEQAEHFLSVLPDEPGMLPAAVDLELKGNCDERPDVASVTRELDAFLTRVEADTGLRAVLYVGDDFEESYPVKERAECPLWVLRYLLRPGGDWLIWQVGGYASVEGIRGRVDLDVMKPSG